MESGVEEHCALGELMLTTEEWEGWVCCTAVGPEATVWAHGVIWPDGQWKGLKGQKNLDY